MFEIGGLFEVNFCIVGVFCIINCYFNAFIGLCVFFFIYEHILKICFCILYKMSQKCEPFSYELFLVICCDFL